MTRGAPGTTWMLTAAGCLAVAGIGYYVVSVTNTDVAPPEIEVGVDRDGGDWAVREGFALEADTSGYRFPTAIAFVPEPGPDPDDPLYFVAELRGRLKVVTNDRTVRTFAEDFFDLVPDVELPNVSGECGLAGLCLEPERGFVFVTFTRQDAQGRLRNRILRFESTPGTFSTQPTGQQVLCPLLDEYPSAVAHQIGPPLVHEGLLYVPVGDGRHHEESRNLHSPLGKILRMTLDGRPAPGNPHRVDDDPAKAINYVWVSGVRNVFSLSAAQGRLFAGDNGVRLDRFVELEAGRDYGWDGTDWSMGVNVPLSMLAVSPTGTQFLPRESELFPERYRETFFCALSGSPGARPGNSAIALFRYDFEHDRAADQPRIFLNLRTSATRVLTGLAFGPDGLYFSAVMPDAEGHSSVMRVSYDPEREHRYVVGRDEGGAQLVQHYGCQGCHDMLTDQPGRRGPSLAPGLDERLRTRLDSDEYAARLRKLDGHAAETFVATRPWRARVLELSGRERVRYWLERHLLDPKFDNEFAQMPDFGMSEEHARSITEHLLGRRGAETRRKLTGVRRRLGALLPRSRAEVAILMFALGAAATLLLSALLGLRRRRKAA